MTDRLQELEARLSELKKNQASEKRAKKPSETYLADLGLSITNIEKQIAYLKETGAKFPIINSR